MMLGVGASTTQTAFACAATQLQCVTNPCGGTDQYTCTKPRGDGTSDFYTCLASDTANNVRKCVEWYHIIVGPGEGSGGSGGNGSEGGGSEGGGTTKPPTAVDVRISFIPNISGDIDADKTQVGDFPDDIVKSCTGTESPILEIPSNDMVRIDDARIRFSHWNSAKDDSGSTDYLPGEKVAMQCGETLTLYAQWQSAPSDTTPPVISGANDTTIRVGDKFDPKAGVTAKDDVDGDLTANIKVTGSVDNATPGSYKLTYTVSDKAGNKATATRTITVVTGGATIACAPQTGADPASSVWQAATFVAGGVMFGLAFMVLRLKRQLSRRI